MGTQFNIRHPVTGPAHGTVRYRRVGLADVPYEWVCRALTQTVSLS